jgi:hypothetical protein
LKKNKEMASNSCYLLPGCRLYESFGFQVTSWVDPLWLADAEKGRVRQKRRLLLTRPLQV